MNLPESADSKHTAYCERLSPDNPRLFINRELSWIEFNSRLLHEARSKTTPLLERAKFLAILSTNVDEFYMKRLGALKHKIAAGHVNPSIDGLSPAETLTQCRIALQALQLEKEQVWRQVSKELEHHDIEICQYNLLNNDEKTSLRDEYLTKVQPLLMPWVVDLTHPFPFVSNLSLNLLVSMQRPGDKGIHLARIKIPTSKSLTRFVQIGKALRFVLIEDLIIAHLGHLFPQANIVTIDMFRLTRSAVLIQDHAELEDPRVVIEQQLSARKFAPVVRLQVSPSMSPTLRHALASNLGLDHENDIIESREILRMSDINELASLNLPQLRDEPHSPAKLTALSNRVSIFSAIRKQSSIVLQHPYDCFTHTVECFVREASQDPDVATIAMTLYRTSAGTRIVDYLIRAAKRGKQVLVVIELKARFDEAANLRWARQLERAGVHVNYGIEGLKTHCKCILVVRREADRLRRYAHIGTGNYHAGTAQLYSDVGLLTCDDELNADIGKLFNYLTTACLPSQPFNQIMATPHAIKRALLAKIDREISVHSDSTPGYICMKTNALEDPDITIALYRASKAGVKIDLIVRDICRLRAGLAGVSDNIRVISIVGRFLEHSRLYQFRNGGDEELYIGSADLMTRNLERRVELLIPVREAASKQLLLKRLSDTLRDNCCAWQMHADGRYSRRQPDTNAELVNSQDPKVAACRTSPTSVCLEIVKKNASGDSGLLAATPYRAF